MNRKGQGILINRNEDFRLVDIDPYRPLAEEIAEITHQLDQAQVLHNMYNLVKTKGVRLGGADSIIEAMKSRFWEYTWTTVHSGVLERSPTTTRVLDFGCGGSTFAYFLAKRGYEVHLLDLPGAFGYAYQADIKRYLNLDNIYIHTGSIESTSFPNNFFDVIFSISVLEHMVPVLQRTFDEIERILKPGGVLATTVNFNLIRYDATEYAPGGGHWPLDFYLIDELEKVISLKRMGNRDVFWDPRAEGTGFYRNGNSTTRCGGNINRPYFVISIFYQKVEEYKSIEISSKHDILKGLPYSLKTDVSRRTADQSILKRAKGRVKAHPIRFAIILSLISFLAGVFISKLL